MELCVLASGSSGNCSIIRANDSVFLVDCGIGPRTTIARLAGTGVQLSQIQSICLTHLDRDHFNPAWTATIVSNNIRLFCPMDRAHEVVTIANNQALRPLIVPFKNQPFEPVTGITARTLRLAHDRTGSHAFHFTGGHGTIGYATDLGRVPEALVDHFCGVDLLAIESNYDPHLQRTSGRPLFLQKRITGGGGHLSNAQALSAVKSIFDRCTRSGKSLPQKVVLLHRSRQCNCPKIVMELFQSDARIASRVVLSEQFDRTGWLSVSRSSSWSGQQMLLDESWVKAYSP